MGEVEDCWQCSPGLCNPCLPPSVPPPLSLGSAVPAGATPAWGESPSGQWGLQRDGWGGHGGGRKRHTRHGPLQNGITWSIWKEELTGSWQWSSVPSVHYVRQSEVTGRRRLQNPPDPALIVCSQCSRNSHRSPRQDRAKLFWNSSHLTWLSLFPLLIALRVDSSEIQSYNMIFPPKQPMHFLLMMPLRCILPCYN